MRVASLIISGRDSTRDTVPGETPAMMEASVGAINSLALDTVKFHQVQLFRGTTMAGQ